MRQYFKDYKAKMEKEEKERAQNESVNFYHNQLNSKDGIFVKRKSRTLPSNSDFFFNFENLNIN